MCTSHNIAVSTQHFPWWAAHANLAHLSTGKSRYSNKHKAQTLSLQACEKRVPASICLLNTIDNDGVTLPRVCRKVVAQCGFFSGWSLKGYSTQKWKFWYHLLTLKLLQTCMSFFCWTQRKIFWRTIRRRIVLQNIFLCVQQKK